MTIQTLAALRQLYAAPQERAIKKQIAALDAHCLQFIKLSPFAVLATANAQQQMDASPRGGPPGFIRPMPTGRFDDDSMWVDLDDGRRIAVPLAWFPRLLAATPEQRNQFELSPRGIHWEALDEDISVDGLLAGHGDRTHGRLIVPA